MDPDEDSRVSTMMRRCGELTDLFIDWSEQISLGSDCDVSVPTCAATDSRTMRRLLVAAPLLVALQADAAECDCSPLGSLSVQRCSTSGSSVEGLTGLRMSDSVQRISDIDMMLELGPVSWVLDVPHDTGSSPPSVPSLTLTATENPGFVQVLQVRRAGCDHGQSLPFSAAIVRRLMADFIRFMHPEANSIELTGPAVTVDSGTEMDWVACLRIPWQQSRESFLKTTTLGWLSDAAREDIWRYGMHLVPTGYKGSVTEETEWRLSFSRAELVAAWHLPDDQKYAVVILKRAKKELGASGRTVKSYFIKNSLFWVCQRTPRHRWGGPTQCAQRILDYLHAAVAARLLPAFFGEDINLLRQATPADLEVMQQTIGVLQAEFTRLVMRDILQRGTHSRVVRLVLSSRHMRLSEHQLRIYIARVLIVHSVLRFPVEHAIEGMAQFCLPTMLRIATTKEMLQLSSSVLHPMGSLKGRLLQAMAVAPDDVVGHARLTPCPGGGFTWDVAPLMALLTANDISEMFEDAPAVFAWWRRQLTRPVSERPAGLSAELNTPRGLAQLVANPSLLVRALDESVPGWRDIRNSSALARIPPQLTYQHHKDKEMKLTLTQMTVGLQVRLHLSQTTAHRIARRWRMNQLRYWYDPKTETRFKTYSRDPWQLWQFFRRLIS